MRAKLVNEYVVLPPKSKEDIIRDFSALSKDELNKQLFKAAENGLTNIVQWILNAGADVNAKDHYGWTALMFASNRCHNACVKLLLDNGADVNAKSNAGWTVLMDASYYGHEACVRLLLANGADVNAKTNIEQTALMWVSHNRHKDIVELLKKYE